MKKLLLVFSLCLTALAVEGQIRYRDEVFSNVIKVADVNYGFNVSYGQVIPDSIKMDIYMPAGDTASQRPLLIFAHAGSFLNPTILGIPGVGTKEDSVVVETCKSFARRGYVAVAMAYRVGWNPGLSNQIDRS
ncbi:MAG: hypothetical protein NZ108_10340, partial [Bacteroidia bacterium]|nr:hypothetical protein [Bacteroidia bacterium]